MWGWFNKLMRLLLRPETEGAGGEAASVQTVAYPQVWLRTSAADVEIRPPTQVISVTAVVAAPQTNRHLAQRLGSVGQINQPKSRAKKKLPRASGPADKPIRKAEPVDLKRRPDASGARRIRSVAPAAAAANVIDLAGVRASRLAAA